MLSLGLITLKIIDTVLTPLHEPCYNHALQCVYNYNDMHLNLIHACMPSCFSCIQFSTFNVLQPARLLFVHGVLQAKILQRVCHALLQGIFPMQGSNPMLLLCLLDWQTGSLPLAPPGKPLYVISLCNFDEFELFPFLSLKVLWLKKIIHLPALSPSCAIPDLQAQSQCVGSSSLTKDGS